MQGIKNKHFLITGISSALGKAIAIQIVKEGGEVTGTYRTNDSEMNEVLALENKITLLQWDAQFEPDFIKDIKPIHAWVHCIGSIHPLPIKYLKKEGKEDLIQSNFLSAVNVASALLQHNKIQNNASLVFLSSISSHFPYRGGSVYAASKAALETFAKSLALECASKKIRVNVLACGPIKTPMYDASIQAYSSDEIQLMEAKYPLGIGDPSDVVGPCLFLLSDDSAWMTGSIITLDGGLLLNSVK